MKFQIKNIVAVLALALAFTSCTDDNETISGEGAIKLEFDNVYGAANLAFNTAYTNTNGEVIKVSNAIYIISNIVLTKEDGSTYTMPKSESYFFVNEADATSTILNLPNIPAANYTKVSFGVGVDQAQFNAGADGQGTMWTDAQALGMTWSWAAGYKFVKFEGTVTSTTHTNANFRVHTGKTGDIYNYATITLNFPNKALVRTNVTPQVHVLTDLKKVIEGTTVINFNEGLDVMGGTKVQNISANNVPNIFSIDHVHND
ncbi:MAG TPA: hypothetical protein DCM02_04750 [Flavobacterium sp.]|nr:hypothetical protein [Flavobacterium sp.]HAT77307.1 hypothetical protein [Flavobacterium sp.]